MVFTVVNFGLAVNYRVVSLRASEVRDRSGRIGLSCKLEGFCSCGRQQVRKSSLSGVTEGQGTSYCNWGFQLLLLMITGDGAVEVFILFESAELEFLRVGNGVVRFWTSCLISSVYCISCSA